MWHQFVLPADIGKASTLLVPISQFAIPVNGPRGDAQVPFSGHRGTGVGCLAAPGCVQNPTWLSRVAGSATPNNLLDVVTAGARLVVAWETIHTVVLS